MSSTGSSRPAAPAPSSGGGSASAAPAKKPEETKAVPMSRLETVSKQLKALKTRELHAHKKEVRCAAWNCTGQKLAAGSADHTVRCVAIDPRGPQGLGPEFELKAHTDAVDQLCWHKSSSDLLATASSDKAVRLWDTKQNKCIATVETRSGGASLGLTWSPDGNYVVAAHTVNEILFHGSKYLLVSTGNGTIAMAEFPKLEIVHSVKAHAGHAYCMDIDIKARYMATGGGDAMVTLWDLNELVCVRTLDKHENQIRSVSFSHDGSLIASLGEDSKIDISDVDTGETVHTIEARGQQTCLAFNPKALLLAYAGEEGSRGSPGILTLYGFAN